ncbi:type II toxin-antitoxin system VapC family toxin [Methanoplanus endosymbiosus]|jgi:predicted nucleic acid-binding protein|uniref:Type II toxin-antitoxin system VapC family toxin n=1 Tax=Methanoplanus endosymbiosus TaxID=33865 RepID=A0A9E7PP91_9EURY|nr:type II toxin-antitoxin system VapC family toxin [Methanoplanus endosymbiosus]UUX92531.1 type II toxin-antitoxin system VapC family toxin [Methanoplanus endosymbiosus]
MIILDSTFIIDLLAGKKDAIEFLREKEAEDVIITTTFVNILELHKGAFRSRNTQKEIDKINLFIDKFDYLGFSPEVNLIFGKISAYLKSCGKPAGQFDELIASIALLHNAHVVTNNTKDFSKIPGLKIIKH